jgi:hypothetical protein
MWLGVTELFWSLQVTLSVVPLVTATLSKAPLLDLRAHLFAGLLKLKPPVPPRWPGNLQNFTH